MRLSKTFLIILGIGLFVIVGATLGWLYFQEKGKQQMLEEELATLEATLPPLTAEQQQWQARLTSLQSQLSLTRTLFEMAKESFPETVDSTDVDERLFQTADGLELEVISISTAEPKEEQIDKVSYSVTSFSVTVEGKKVAEPGFATQEAYREYIDRVVNALVAYISSITTDTYFGNATIRLASMSIPALPTDEQVERQGAEIERPSVTITIDIYGYQEAEVENNG
jgi:hypothetical protein